MTGTALTQKSGHAPSTLNATGTVSDSIVFTALTDDGYGGDTNQDLGATTAAPGYWDRIWFRGTNSSASTLRYCVVRYGGSAGAGNVYCANNGGSTAPTIRECRIEASSNYGLRTDGCAPKLYDSTLQWNGSFAVQVVGTTGTSYRSASEPSLPEDVFQKNGFDAVGVLGGSSGTDVGGTWPKVGSGYPYVVRQNLRVYGTTLAISPGVVVKFNPVTYLLVESSDGTTSTLNATGTAATHIVFTALTDDGFGGDTNGDGTKTTPTPGYWDRVWVRGANASASALRYCVIRYGGSGGHAQVWCDNTGTAVAPNVQIQNSRFFVDISPGGVQAGNNANPRIQNCAFLGPSSRLGVQNTSTAVTVDATGNWWGAVSGPYDNSPGPPDQNSSGTGVGVSDYVAYRAWLLSDPVSDPAAQVSPTALGAAAAPGGIANLDLAITNTGGADLTFSIQEIVGVGAPQSDDSAALRDVLAHAEAADVPWLSESPISGTVAVGVTSHVTVSFNSAGLAEARHTAYLFVTTNDPNNPQTVVPVTFDVGVPQPPDTVTLVPPRNGSALRLAWNPSVSAGIAGYHVYRSSISGQLGSAVGGLIPGTSLLDTGLDDNATYYYTVRTLSLNGLESANSNVASGTAHDAVVMVHGFIDNHTVWRTYAAVLRARGLVVYDDLDLTPNYDDPGTLAPELNTYLENLGLARVNIVAHSMGGLVTREVIARRFNARLWNPIGNVVMVATPNHGSEMASLGVKLAHFYKYFVDPLAPNPLTRAAYDLFLDSAIPALSTGSAFLNALNYGAGPGEAPGGQTCLTAHAEAGYFPSIHYYTIGGTAEECGAANRVFRSLWRCSTDGGRVPHDGWVSTYSARLSNGQSTGWDDVQLGVGALTHSSILGACHPRELESTALAGKVADILTGNIPAGGTTPREAGPLADAVVDTLPNMVELPSMEGTINPSQILTDSLIVGATGLLRIYLAGDSAGLSLSLLTPDSLALTPADTLTYPGLTYEEDSALGLSVYDVASPLPGKWRFRVSAPAVPVPMGYQLGKFVQSALALEGSVSPGSASPGTPVLLAARLSSAGVPTSSSSALALVRAQAGGSTTVPLFDDGTHGDATAGDLIYSASYAPGFGMGSYTAIFDASSGGVTATRSVPFTVAARPDLSILPGSLRVTAFPDSIGDAVGISCTVTNAGTATAESTEVILRDVTNGFDLATSTLGALTPGHSQAMLLNWSVAPPDTHVVRVIVNPFGNLVEASYANNWADATIWIGHGATAVGPHEPPAHSRLVSLGPSPARGIVQFVVDLASGEPAALELFDVLGRRIRDYEWRSGHAGRVTVSWDGALPSGARVGPGVYFARFTTRRGATVSRLILLR